MGGAARGDNGTRLPKNIELGACLHEPMKELGEYMDVNSYRSTKGVCGPLSNEGRRDGVDRSRKREDGKQGGRGSDQPRRNESTGYAARRSQPHEQPKIVLKAANARTGTGSLQGVLSHKRGSNSGSVALTGPGTTAFLRVEEQGRYVGKMLLGKFLGDSGSERLLPKAKLCREQLEEREIGGGGGSHLNRE